MRKLGTIIAGMAVTATMLIGAFVVPVVLAGTQGSCLASDTTKVQLRENMFGDASDNNDVLWKCGSDSDLSNDSHTLSGNCQDGVPPGNASWNDCVSSFSVWIPDGWKFCTFGNANYSATNPFGPPYDVVIGPRTNYGLNITAGNDNDDLSSFRWVTMGSSCDN